MNTYVSIFQEMVHIRLLDPSFSITWVIHTVKASYNADYMERKLNKYWLLSAFVVVKQKGQGKILLLKHLLAPDVLLKSN